MTSMIDQFTNDVTTNVISQITEKLLPAIADRYDIPLAELVTLVNNKAAKKSTIKAKPKASAKQASNELQLKIAKAQEQGKVLNVSTGRPLADTPANRKKFKFFVDLGIAGTKDDEKLTETLKLLGAPAKKEVPAHKQAARAKQRAKEQESASSDDGDDDDDDESLDINEYQDADATESDTDGEVSEKPAPKKKTSIKAKTIKKKTAPAPDDDDEDNDDNSEAEPAPKKKTSIKAKTIKKKTAPAPDGDDDDEDNDDNSEAEPVPKKKTSIKAKTIKKKAAPPPDESETENVDTVLKISKLIEETNANDSGSGTSEADDDSDADEEPNTAAKPPKLAFNSKIRKWWNVQTGFVLIRKGIKCTVIGKLVNDKVVALSAVDLKKCKKLGWVTDTTVLNNNSEESESE